MFMDPKTLLSMCNLQITDSVADFGAGSGFVARAATTLVTSGAVFAVEINKDIIARLAREVTELQIQNLHPIWGDIEVVGGSKLADASMDFVILSNIMFHLDDKEGCIKEVRRVLKDGGRVLLADWSESFGGMGPQPQAVFAKDRAKALFQQAGFSILNDMLPAGEHHYAILFHK